MAGQPIARRAGAFVHSVLPAEPTHWLLLVGSTFLFISRTLRWWPRFDFVPGMSVPQPYVWRLEIPGLGLGLMVAGSIGLFAALVKTRKPARLLFFGVVLLSLATLVLIGAIATLSFGKLGEPGYFAPSLPGAPALSRFQMVVQLTANLSVGWRFANVGLVLVAIFLILFVLQRSSLPMSVRATSNHPLASPPGDQHRRTMLFVWAMICLVALPDILSIAILLGVRQTRYAALAGTTSLTTLVFALPLLAFVLLAVGKEGRKLVGKSLRLPHIRYVALAAFVPAAVGFAWPTLTFAYARVHWTTYERSRGYPAPDAGDYFRLPGFSSLWLLVPALVEEVAWRGYLQPQFVRRYGLARGVFFVGLIWGAFHFSWNFHSTMTDQRVLLTLSERLLGTVVLSYVLAWLTIQSKSILPAGIAHATYNIFITDYSFTFRTPWWLAIVLWAAVGYLLFRYFPPTKPAEPTALSLPQGPVVIELLP